MTKSISLPAFLLCLVLFAGCTKEKSIIGNGPNGSETRVPLKISNLPVDFSGLGTVLLTEYVPTQTQTEFIYVITAGSSPIVRLDLGIQLYDLALEVLTISGATANYAADPGLNKSPIYKGVKWLVLTTPVSKGTPVTVSFTLKGYWNCEPRTSVLIGNTSFEGAPLEVPVREDGSLATVKTLSIGLAPDGKIKVTCEVTNDGGSEVYDRGVYYNYTGFVGPEIPADAIMVKAPNPTGTGLYECILPPLSEGQTIYAISYVFNRYTSRFSNGQVAYGSVLKYPKTEIIYGEFTDNRDGYEKKYKTIDLLDGNTWMAENLAYLPDDNYFYKQINKKTRQYSGIFVYNYQGTSSVVARSTTYYEKYGCLYDWEHALTACPTGTHLPSDQEWKALEIAYGMPPSEAELYGLVNRASGEVGLALRTNSSDDWFWDQVSGNFVGNNKSGFSAIGSGRVFFFNTNSVNFMWEGQDAIFWTSTMGPNGPISRDIKFSDVGVGRTEGFANIGFSVRCIIDK